MSYFLNDEDRFVFVIGPNLLHYKDGVIFTDGYIDHVYHRYFNHDEIGKVLNNTVIKTAANDEEAYGEWLTVVKQKKSIEVRTDYFGFYRLYYATLSKNGESNLIISNCFNSLSDYILNTKNKALIDYVSFFPILNSSHVFFANNYSTSTANEKIKSLRPDQKIIYCAITGKIEVVSRNVERCNDSVEELIDKGHTYFTEQAKELLPFNSNLFFSGGNDSRVCLAGLLSTLDRSNFKLTTAIPTGRENPTSFKILRNDFQVANYIKNKLNLEWYPDNYKGSLEFSSDNYLNYISKYRTNSYFSNIALGNRVACSSSEEDTEVQIRGGAGEILRVSALYDGIYKNAIKKGNIRNDTHSIEDDLSIVFNAICPSNKNSTTLHKLSKDFFINYISDYEGENLEQKINHRFFLERNNRHFGHHREKLAFGKRTFFPLANPYWHAAAKKFDFNERKNKKILSFVYEKFNSGVETLPFSGDPISKNLDYEEGLIDYKNFKRMNEKPLYRHPSWKSNCDLNMMDYVKLQIHEMINSIRDYSSSGENLMNDDTTSFISTRIKAGGVALMSIYMKVKSVHDAIHPSVRTYKIYK